MKFSTLAATALMLVAGLALADDKGAPQTAADLKDVKQQASYGIGLGFGRNVKAQSLDLDVEALLKGIRDGLSDAKPLLSDEEIEKVMATFRDELIAQRTVKLKADAEKNKAEGAAFLAENKKKPGVKTTASGLQYQIVAEGTGASPKPTDIVKVHYRGTLLNGTEFDSSYKRNEPASFPLNQVIKGWTEGLQLLKVGGKAKLFIPSELAYGENPRPGGPIPPNAVLIFDVELLGIE